ncbi:hypothetical protein VOLCADRAFT_103554 [Volvox carteri f. nagariensis]|uniref:Transmembrane protein n=1 Tax=Volvox carteri f. nagariensis TaxID=3068 RepID=D8TMS0_VOLCA|nr:uncharacterized protein VOLCADRAFT_103554 [Volvox carteri f. nagariensis]EFJ51176.1 hypothetical protein VOLCADRAFT_103554 [Volvox carteri f. nagariensis]|eukprot:XP_002947643.1 hypothetical protein VOLCADRAFT_103554 [Volvox carteri f. nagariensis]
MAHVAMTRHFNTAFDPSKSNIPAEYNFVQPMLLQKPEPTVTNAENVVVADVGPYAEFDPTFSHPKESYWRGPAPEGSFTVGNTYAQRTRLTPLRVPELGATGPRNPLARVLSPFSKEEYYAVEMDLDYGREWPRIVWENGGPVLRPGFLQPFIDPDYPPYWLHRGIARFEISASDRVMQAFVGALYVAVLAAASAALYTFKPALFAAVVVSWARNTLSLAKWAVLLGLAAADRMYLYWVFLAAKLVDGVLARHLPPVRKFCWANFLLWVLYLALCAYFPVHPREAFIVSRATQRPMDVDSAMWCSRPSAATLVSATLTCTILHATDPALCGI